MDDLIERLATAYRGTALPHPNLKAVTFAQWLLESGRGTSALARDHLNFAGLKWRPEMASVATRVDYAAHDGADAYCQLASLRAFIAGYWAFLARKPYAGWLRLAENPAGFIRFVGPIYTPSAGYAARVLALLPEAEAMLRHRDLGIVVLDPGHGGTAKLPGSSPNNATSVSGVAEKTLTLDFGFCLRDALIAQSARAGETIRVALTRDRDVNVAGADRAGLAGKLGARAFLSLHFNGAADRTIRGTETFYRAGANGIVNAASDITFAGAVQGGLLAGLRAIEGQPKDRGVKPDTQSGPGGLGVLNPRALGKGQQGRACVAALAEVEFITNPAVDYLIVSGSEAAMHRRAVAEPLATAILGWLRG
jgi:N-acetylmuramoyl-L-alanine amidase